MGTAKIHYKDSLAREVLLLTLSNLLDNEAEPIYVCIGSDRHILDCFGPLTGTMLQAYDPELPVLGTLDKPMHAQNLRQGIKEAQQLYRDKTIIAIDASVGDEKEIGFIQIRPGSLVPGKAFAKNLPAVGQFAITGVVDVRLNKRGARSNNHPGLGLVYNMAQLLSETIGEWHCRRHRS